MKFARVFFILNLIVGSVFAGVECPKGKHWVHPHIRRAYVRYDGTLVKSTKVSGHCRINPRGYDKWHQSFSTKRPKVWGYKKEKSKKWTQEELQRLYDAVSVLPEKLLSLKNVKVYRMKDSQFKENPATTNVSEVVLYDKAFNHSDPLAQIISHEFSHILYDRLNNKDKKNFRENAGWIEHKEFKGYFITDKKKSLFSQIVGTQFQKILPIILSIIYSRINI